MKKIEATADDKQSQKATDDLRPKQALVSLLKKQPASGPVTPVENPAVSGPVTPVSVKPATQTTPRPSVALISKAIKTHVALTPKVTKTPIVSILSTSSVDESVSTQALIQTGRKIVGLTKSDIRPDAEEDGSKSLEAHSYCTTTSYVPMTLSSSAPKTQVAVPSQMRTILKPRVAAPSAPSADVSTARVSAFKPRSSYSKTSIKLKSLSDRLSSELNSEDAGSKLRAGPDPDIHTKAVDEVKGLLGNSPRAKNAAHRKGLPVKCTNNVIDFKPDFIPNTEEETEEERVDLRIEEVASTSKVSVTRKELASSAVKTEISSETPSDSAGLDVKTDTATSEADTHPKENYSYPIDPFRGWSIRAHRKKYGIRDGSQTKKFKRICVLPYCRKRGPQPGVTLHKFPTDPAKFKKWVANCQSEVTDQIVFEKRHLKTLCNAHFHESQVTCDGMLFSDAIPTEFAQAKHPLPYPLNPKIVELRRLTRMTGNRSWLLKDDVLALTDNSAQVKEATTLQEGPPLIGEGTPDSTVALQIEKIDRSTGSASSAGNATKKPSNNVILTGSKAGVYQAIRLITAKSSITLPSESKTSLPSTEQQQAKKQGDMKETIKMYKQQIRTMTKSNNSKVKRLEEKIQRLTMNTRCSVQKLRKGVGCMKSFEEILPPTLYHLVALKVRYGDIGKRFCVKWPPCVKDWALSIYRTSPRAYNKLQDLFILPSRGHVQAMNRTLLQKEYQEGNGEATEIAESDAPPSKLDYSQFEIVEKSNKESCHLGKSDESLKENSSALKRKLDAPIKTVDVHSLAKRLKGLFES